MKRLRCFGILFCLIVLVFVFSGMTVLANEEETCGENAAYSIDSSGTMTVSGKGKIEANAFYKRSDIKQVYIGEGITSLGD